MSLLCDPEWSGSLYNSTVSLLFNYFMSLHALSLHQDYEHFVFKDLILCNTTLLIWYPAFSIIVLSKQLFALNIKRYFVLITFSHFNNSLPS